MLCFGKYQIEELGAGTVSFPGETLEHAASGFATSCQTVLRISKPAASPVQPENSLSWVLLGGAQTLDANGRGIFVESSVSASADRDQEKQGRAAA